MQGLRNKIIEEFKERTIWDRLNDEVVFLILFFDIVLKSNWKESKCFTKDFA